MIVDRININTWLHSQRNKYKNGKISPESRQKLEQLGINWTVYGGKWEEAFTYARMYFMEHQDLNVQQSYVCENGFKLGVVSCY